MKKRMLCALLLIGTLLSLFPVQTVAAEETLIKDETPALTTDGGEENSLLTDYDKLYVGADGSPTANGGKLIGLYTAYGTDYATVTLSADKTNGAWKNKMDATGATDAVLRDTYTGTDWVKDEKGGIGYHTTGAEWNATATKIGITLPAAWAELADFTVEQAAALDAVEHTSALSSKHSAVRLDLFLGLWLPSGSSRKDDQSYCWRWSYGVYQDWKNTIMSSQEFAHREAFVSAGKAVGIVTAFSKKTSSAGVSYSVSHNVSGSYEKLCYTLEEYAAIDKNVAFNDAKKEGNYLPIFSLMNGVPGTVYAIRVYDAALTDAEKCQNALVDIMAFNGIDPEKLFALPSTARGMIVSAMSAYTMSVDPQTFSAALDEWLELFGAVEDISSSLYVTDGLTLFTSAYGTMSTGTMETGDGLTWINAVNPIANITMKDTDWTANADGGITIVKNHEEYMQNKSFGMYLSSAALPERSYTVEFVYNPTGLTELDENGNLQRYESATYNHVDDGIIIGPLRCLQFSAFRPAGMDGRLERRWVYNPKSSWLGDQVPDYWEKTWANLELTQIVTYAITHDYNEGAPRYQMYNDFLNVETIEVSADKYATPAAAGNKFRLLVGVAGTAFSVRVYDRVLSADEMAQNHVADIFYFYGLDPSLLEECKAVMDGREEFIYSAFKDLGFDLTPEEAEAEFKKRISAIWLTYQGVGVRKDGVDNVRFYFGVAEEAVRALASAGMHVEVGALVNLNKNTAPLLEGAAYDYKVVGYDSDSGKNRPFFVDDDTFAVTVKYENVDKVTAITPVSVRGYVKLTQADGTVKVYYADTFDSELLGNTLFGIYNQMKDTESVKSVSTLRDHLKKVEASCYEKIVVYAQAGAAAGGDGTAAKPYASFSAAYDKCKELLAKAATPVRVVLMLRDGEYGVYTSKELAAEDMPFKYSELEITSENGKSILTTTKNIDAADFTRYADNVWVCQLEKEDGAYPSFRYLYVDGEMADLSYSGPRYSDDEEEHFVSAFERTYDGPWGRANELYKAGLLTADSESGYPAERTDLIASFEVYKKKFLALKEMEDMVKAKTLTVLSEPKDTSDAEYVEYFEQYKLLHIAREDLKEQNKVTNELLDYNASLNNFRKFKPSPEHTVNEGYEAVFIATRDKIVSLSSTSISFGGVPVTVETTAQAEGKYYLNLDMIGDLSAALAEGKAMNEAAFKAIKAAYEAADEAGKAEMQAEYDLAALKVGEHTWFRYALEGKGLEMHLAGQWWYNIVHVTGVDYDDYAIDADGATHVAVYLDLDEYAYFHVHKTYSMVGRYVHMKGAFDYVDSEGEYYYDETTGKLYYYSEEGVAGKNFAHATSDNIFTFVGVKNVTLSDLEITGVDDNYLSHNHGCYGLGGVVGTNLSLYNDRGAIRLLDCYGLDVLNCNFHDLGDRALFGEGKIENIYIEGCSFTRLGGGAIHFGAGESHRKWDYNLCYIEDVTITDNYIYDVGREYYADSAIWLHYGKDVKINHNTVDRSSYTAISVGWQFNIPTWTPGEIYHMYNVEIAYNYISNFMHETGDGGAIYVTGGNAAKDITDYFNSIHNNYVMMTKNTGNGLGHMLVGIYFDGSTSNWECYENVIAEFSYGAVEGENDGFDLEDPDTVKYLEAMRKRYSGTTYIYLQHIVVQITHNILCRDNYILNVRATNPEEQKKEVYKGYVVADRNLKEENTRYADINHIPIGAEDIIYAAGCYGHTGDATQLYGNDY